MEERIEKGLEENFSLVNYFDKPKIISIVGDIGEAKSNTLYYIIEELKKIGTYNLFVYGLRIKIPGSIEINSINELEEIKNSIIILDELMSLWDLENRMAKRKIELTLRMLQHNNNILIISAVPENLKKFISSKINLIIYKKVTFDDFINGSSVKRIILNYKGAERGTTLLDLPKDEAIVFDGKHYHKINIPYLVEYDSKKDNPEIINKIVKQNVNHLVKEKNVI